MAQLFVLFEHAIGYSLYKVKEFEEVGAFLPQVEEATQDPAKFKKVVQLVAFRASTNAVSALENMNAVSEGILTDELSAFLDVNMPKSNNKSTKITLGVIDPKLASSIGEALKIDVTTVGVIPEIVRGIRFHMAHFVKGLDGAAVRQSELGLGHSYSRGKVKFNVNRVDQMIIQSISLVDLLDKDINTFAMRIREWYSYHFPELSKVVADHYQFAQCAYFIKDRNTLTSAAFDKLEEITKDSAKAQAVLDGARMSMGMDISPVDLRNIESCAKRVIKLSEYRTKLFAYLRSKMDNVAPNLATLIGETVGARLISHAGSLTNLAKYPASTVQILGAEKALFRALKLKGNTPKYGLIYHSSFIGRAETSNKGRISRYLANKCSLASRIDCFSENLTTVFGQKLKDQVEDRLTFYRNGEIPRKNVEVMEEAAAENEEVVRKLLKEKKKLSKQGDENDNFSLEQLNGANEETKSPKKKKKKKISTSESADDQTVEEQPISEKKKKKKKALDEDMEVEVAEEPAKPVSEKKKKKKAFEVEEEIEEPVSEKKKKKRKSMETGEMFNGSAMDGSTEEKSPKKKKKSPDDSKFNCTIDELNISGLTGSAKKKKKKAKTEE